MEPVTSVGSRGSLELNLACARGAAQLRQRRVQVPCLTVGGILLCASILLRLLLTFCEGLLPSWTVVGVTTFGILSAVFLMLAMLPTQEKAIRYLTVGLSISMALVVVSVGVRDVRSVLRQELATSEHQHRPAWYVNTTVAISSGLHVVFGLFGFSLRMILVWCKREPGRRHLEMAWRILAQTSVIFTAGHLGWLFFVVEADLDGPSVFWMRLGITASWAVVACLSVSSRLRGKFQACLAERGEQASAALVVVGALLGDRPLRELMSMARGHFRCVSLDRVTKAMIESNEPNPELHVLTERRALGDVDAFISHSWHDDPEEKWEALQRWRAEFKLTMGREPRVWFDKFSIDQKNIQDSLAGLPIYLAGCSKLLVLMGSTYAARLWCLVELFAFIVMGGERAQLEIEVLPSCRKGLGVLDVQAATCTVEEDKSRLLGIIEAGLGSLESFNHQVRALGVQHEPLQRAWTEATTRAPSPVVSDMTDEDPKEQEDRKKVAVDAHSDCDHWGAYSVFSI